ncbi:MAG: tRNA (adenosine(37)-N6)-dimethylallyltransferase MiaA [Chlorobi bacterium]|nr:tRNA (adenosine(37)-N6)-dimethylallyltransferase MiaA [Chlorobiota bacterium]
MPGMYNMITILGPTATGKTRLAAKLAYLIGGEIISADSRQVYKGMDIGTGKDLNDYVVNNKQIPYHLVNIVGPGYEYNLFEFLRDFTKAFNLINNRHNVPVLCGGTGLYLDAVLRGYQMKDVPENKELREKLEKLSHKELIKILNQYGDLHNTTDITDRNRTIRAIEIREYEKNNPEKIIELPKTESVNFGIRFDRSIIRERITRRLKTRLNEGMVEEVKHLLESGLKPGQLAFYGLEYKYVTQYVTGEINYDEMFRLLNTAIHQFAKRQMTWFRRMEKNGIKIHWVDGEKTDEEKSAFIINFLK